MNPEVSGIFQTHAATWRQTLFRSWRHLPVLWTSCQWCRSTLSRYCSSLLAFLALNTKLLQQAEWGLYLRGRLKGTRRKEVLWALLIVIRLKETLSKEALQALLTGIRLKETSSKEALQALSTEIKGDRKQRAL